MKRIVCLVFALGLLLLCACVPRDYVEDLTGVWQGDGSMDLAPIMGVRVLIFKGDGVLIVEGGTGAGQYKVSATDDTLTVAPMTGDGAFGFAYDIKGDKLILGRGTEFVWRE